MFLDWIQSEEVVKELSFTQQSSTQLLSSWILTQEKGGLLYPHEGG